MQIRPATVADAAAIADVHVRSWQAAYAGLVDADWLAGLSIDKRTQGWQAAMTAGDGTVHVAERDGRVVAFGSHGACRDGGAAPDLGEIWTLYALPEAWGTGAGRHLLQVALDGLAQAGFRRCTLWVLAGNARGRAFYTRFGFHEVPGSMQSFELGGHRVDEIRCERPLDPPP